MILTSVLPIFEPLVEGSVVASNEINANRQNDHPWRLPLLTMVLTNPSVSAATLIGDTRIDESANLISRGHSQRNTLVEIAV